MNATWFQKKLGLALVKIALVLTLASCSGGSETTAGAGGSGVGGTGVTLVRGNVATVVAALEREGITNQIKMLVRILDISIRDAIAAQSVKGISVSGGGRTDVTDDNGRFELINVTPSSNFVLVLKLSGGKQIGLPIGPVQKSQAVQVNNIVIDARNDDASFSSVETKDNSESGVDDEDSDDNDSSDDPDDGDSPDNNDPNDDDD